MAVTGFGVCSAKPFLLEMRRGKPRSKMAYNEKMELRCPRLLSSPFPTGQPQGETSAQQSLGGFPWDYQVPSPLFLVLCQGYTPRVPSFVMAT